MVSNVVIKFSVEVVAHYVDMVQVFIECHNIIGNINVNFSTVDSGRKDVSFRFESFMKFLQNKGKVFLK